MGHDSSLKQHIISIYHDSPQGGHAGVQATTKRVAALLYWPRLKRDIAAYVKKCPVCHKCKLDNSAYPSLLQPLPVPNSVWEDIAMDFIEGLPKSFGKEVILVVVDRLSKYAHFIGLSHPYTSVDVAQAFLDHTYKLHAFPRTIVSGRDKIFLSTFWTELMILAGLINSYRHPTTHKQTVNHRFSTSAWKPT